MRNILFILAALIFTSCSGVYWGKYVNTASGRHYKQVRGWPEDLRCPFHEQYIKPENVKHYARIQRVRRD